MDMVTSIKLYCVFSSILTDYEQNEIEMDHDVIWQVAFYKHSGSAALIDALVPRAATLSGCKDQVLVNCYFTKILSISKHGFC